MNPTKPGIAGGVDDAMVERACLAYNGREPSLAGRQMMRAALEAAFPAVEAIAALPAKWRAEADELHAPAEAFNDSENSVRALVKQLCANELEAAFHGSGPATGDANDECAVCNRTRREHQSGYSASRCNFVLRATGGEDGRWHGDGWITVTDSRGPMRLVVINSDSGRQVFCSDDDHVAVHKALNRAAATGGGKCYGLGEDEIATVLGATLKPEEIAGDPQKQQDRVHELVAWFARLARGNANPKWTTAHAMELAYYLATTGGNRHLDLRAIRQAAWIEGVNLSPAEREMLVRHGQAIDYGYAATPAGGGDDPLAREVRAWLDKLPGAVRICEGGGPENLPASLAVNLNRVTREASEAEARLRQHIERLAEQVNGATEMLAPHFRNVDPMPGDCMIGVNRTVTLCGYTRDIVTQLVEARSLASCGDNDPLGVESERKRRLASAPARGDGPEVLAPIMAELERAMRKFPTWPTDPLHAVAVLGEEYGELDKAVLQAVYEPHKSTPEDVASEAIQTAAMAIRFVASLHRYDYARCPQHEQPALAAAPTQEPSR